MTNDRAVQMLQDDQQLRLISYPDIDHTVALVLRVVRDDLALAELRGELRGFTGGGIEAALNERISNLTGQQTITGDTT